jgi:putative SOS response-associated peptidase YedK
MCGRFVVARAVGGSLPQLLAELPEWEEVVESFNVAPTAAIPLIHNETNAMTGATHRVLSAAHWGFVASWKKSFVERPQPFNARLETIATNGMFRSAFQRHRGIIPAMGYYEWRVLADGPKVPYFITAPVRGLAMAAIFEDWTDPDTAIGAPGKTRRSTTIITRDAIGPATMVHDRMPVLLRPEHYDSWLGDSLGSADEVVRLLLASSQYIAPTLALWPVSPRVGNVRHNDPTLIEPV